MIEKINLIDMSAIIKSGSFSTFDNSSSGNAPCDMFYNGFPTGGIFQFFRYLTKPILKESTPNTMNIACFDCVGPTFRHKIYPEYKGNRKLPFEGYITKDTSKEQIIELIEAYHLDPKISKRFDTPKDTYEHLVRKYGSFIQIDMLHDLLPSIGFQCLQIDEMEADDIILNIIASYPDTLINLYADDKDYAAACLYHDMDSFHQFSVAGRKEIHPKFIPFAEQAISGLPKDHIPSIRRDLGKMYPILKEVFYNPKITINDILETDLLSDIYHFSPNQVHLVKRNMNLVLPAVLDLSNILVEEPSYIDLSELGHITTLFGTYSTANSLGIKNIAYPNENDIKIKYLKQMHTFVREEWAV